MTEFIFRELRNLCTGLELGEADIRTLVDDAKYIIKLGNIARREGLLGLCAILEDDDWDNILEKYQICRLDGDDASFDHYIADLLNLVVDGTDPEYIREIGYGILSTSDFEPVEYIRYVIYLTGIMNIQSGTNLYLLRRLLAAYLPTVARTLYNRELAEEDERNKPSPEELNRIRYEELCDEIIYPYESNEMYDIFLRLDDKGMHTLNSNIDMSELALAMKSAPGVIRKRFLDKLEKLKFMAVMDSMEHMGPVRLKDSIDATVNIFKTLQRLEDMGEIIIK